MIATQGQGDLQALTSVLGAGCDHIAFVGSTKKFVTLSEKLQAGGVSAREIASISAPAGLNIGAVTPEEIALSILAELTQVRRGAVSRHERRDAHASAGV